jgi:hypothetical protein
MAKSKLTDEDRNRIERIVQYWHKDEPIEPSDKNITQACFDIGLLIGMIYRVSAVDVE